MVTPSTKTVINALGDMPEAAKEILFFWFDETPTEFHFTKDSAFDEKIRTRFLSIMQQLSDGLYKDWLKTTGGAVACCIAMDQFPRNAHRDTPAAFGQDHLAREIAQHIRDEELIAELPYYWRTFCFLPFMHSEKLADQDEAIRLGRTFEPSPQYLTSAQKHRLIIARFGRFPHRNEILNRVSTAEELAFLHEPNSSF